MTAASMILLLFVLVFVPMIAEATRAASNERVQRAQGGVEPKGDVYAIMRVAYPAVFLAMIAEGALRPAPIPPAWSLAGGVIFILSKALKWWAILSLGSAWTFRVVVCAGVPRVTTGPYRWLRHPNYLAVVGELIGVALMTGARITGPLGTVCFGCLMLARIRVEERALSGSGRWI